MANRPSRSCWISWANDHNAPEGDPLHFDYPVLLTAVAALAVAGLLGYVVPEVVQVFVSIGQELVHVTGSPWITGTQ